MATSYHFEMKPIYNLAESATTLTGAVCESMDSVVSRITNLTGDHSFKGETASQIKQYLECALLPLAQIFSQAAASFVLQAGKYQTSYRDDVDSYGEANIDTAELTDIIKALTTALSSLAGIDSDVKAAISSIDFESYSYSGTDNAQSKLRATSSFMENICDTIKDIESSFPDSLKELDELLNNARALIADYMSSDLSHFSPSALATNINYINTVKSFRKVDADVQQNSEIFSKMAADRQEAEEELRKEREESAKWMKIGLAVVCTVGAAALACTGVGAVAAGVIIGAVQSGAENLIDQYAETGLEDGVDWGRFAGSCVKGAAIGGVCAFAGGAFGKLSSSLAGNVTKDITKYAIKAGVKSAEKLVTGEATALINNTVDVITGEKEFEQILSGTIVGNAADGKWSDVGKTFGKNAVKGFLSTNVSTVSGIFYDKVDSGNVLGNAVIGGVEDTVKGAMTDFCTTLVDGGTPEQAKDKALAWDARIKDAATGGINKGGESISYNRQLAAEQESGKLDARTSDRELDVLQEKTDEKMRQINQKKYGLTEDNLPKDVTLNSQGSPVYKDVNRATVDVKANAPEDFRTTKDGTERTDSEAKSAARAKDVRDAWKKADMVDIGNGDSDVKIRPSAKSRSGASYHNSKEGLDVHHAYYDVRTDSYRMDFVKSEAHESVHHAGGVEAREQAQTIRVQQADEIHTEAVSRAKDDIAAENKIAYGSNAKTGQAVSTKQGIVTTTFNRDITVDTSSWVAIAY